MTACRYSPFLASFTFTHHHALVFLFGFLFKCIVPITRHQTLVNEDMHLSAARTVEMIITRLLKKKIGFLSDILVMGENSSGK